jgi:N-methylhydantoinase A
VGYLSRPEPVRHRPVGPDASRALKSTREVYNTAKQSFIDTAVYQGEMLQAGNEFCGPAIVEYEGTTVAINSGQTASIDEFHGISIRRTL